ncbi:MAG: 54S ribosomal protein L2 mitochondrial [Candelina mexicana]|nr:MAG: 54S ribosomal protein L2 mitochondrial [Candelina mexicana]
MLIRLQTPLRAALRSFAKSEGISISPVPFPENVILHRPNIPRSPILFSIRYASHQAQGRANGPKATAGRRLGAKKTGEEYVIPGNIIFRQRGTHWFPGENCGMGRDHTIYATETGYVKYYKDPERHPKRQYIGVVFERSQTLPLPRNAARRRRLGMVAVGYDPESTTEASRDLEARESVKVEGVREVPNKKREELPKKELSLRPGYMYREANWEIGRAAERANVKVRGYKPGDRFAAWRKTVIRRTKNAERRAMRRK